MKHSPALAPADLAIAAGRKTRRIQKKLTEAEVDMRSANAAIVSADDERELQLAVKHNTAAERKVHEAVEELEVVREILDQTTQDAASAAATAGSAAGKSGQGVNSALHHLRSRGGTGG